ncbi:hypothetical protein EUX98_g9700 [Antrodiella citrinella]|uniref:MYND-type domain-containing protein n=1 Tax=Antrodiella citrinella TaxID=2447956 RepID=A0A4S4LNY3_9APHY|nr:hypothetical protein EUX98_g9700 [Antrodiella citrinella]
MADIHFCAKCDEIATKFCSVCKHTHYCSERCQKDDWKIHKKGCKIQAQLNIINDAHHEQLKNTKERPPQGKCTGCNVKFTEDYPCSDECSECGYQVCESCEVHQSRGTCYCTNHNFGRKYCAMEPRWYHKNGRTQESYKGDRHPTEEGYIAEVYEPKERACNNCGEVTKVFKKQYCDFREFSSY